MPRRHLTKSGTFEVHREEGSCGLALRHAPTGQSCGGFSHTRIRTFKDALAGMENVERLLGAERVALLAQPDSEPRNDALRGLLAALGETFPLGVWAR